MALVKTNRLNTYSTTGPPIGTGAFTTGSFTPSNNSLLVVCVALTGSNLAADVSAAITLTDSLSSTWTRRLYVGRGPTYGQALAIFTTPITTGQSMTLTADCGANAIWSYAVQAFDFTGYDTGSAIGATITDNAAAADGAESLTLSGAPASSSFVLGFYSAYNGSGTPSSTPGSGWTEMYEVGAATYTYLHSEERTGSTSTAVSWTDVDVNSVSFSEPIAAGIEIKAASSASAAVTGTATASITEADIVAGGKTIIVTLTGDTFIGA